MESLRVSWKRCPSGYKIVETPPCVPTLPLTGAQPTGQLLVPLGEELPYSVEICGRLTQRGNAEKVEGTLLGLANVRDADQALIFAQSFGLPTDGDPRLSTFLSMARALDEGLQYFEFLDTDFGNQALERILNRLHLRSVATLECGMVQRTAPTLHSFCWHLLLQGVSERAPIRYCRVCYDWYLGGRRTGNRTDAQIPKLCGSSRCKDKWQKQGLREAAQAEIDSMIKRSSA